MLYLWDITTAELLVLRTPITHAIELETLGCLPLFVSKVTALFRDRYIPICEMFMDHYYPVCVKTTHSVNLRRGEPLDTSDSMDPACIANGNSDDDDLLSDNENAPRVKRMKVEPSIAASSCSPAAEQTECPRSPRPPDKYSCIGKTSTKYASELRSLGLFYSYLDPSRLDELLVSSRLRCMNGYPEVADFWGTESVYVSVIHSVIGGELVRLNKTVWSAAQLFSCDAFLDIESDYSSFSTVACMDRVEKAAAIAPEIEEGEEEEGADGEDRLSPGPTLTDDSCNKSPGYEVLENFYLSARRGRCIEPLKLCAIDCEMCETAEGLCLTRFTLISPEYGALIDCFIQPREKITNYWTEFSGISETDLENVTSTVGDLHKLLADYNIIAGSTVVIGHSLESDLKAARLVHRKIIDSSLLYPHEKGFPHKHSLKYLAEMYLGKSIQEGCKGHDSIEDAIIALELVAHHLNNHSGGDVRVWPREHRVSLFDRECIGSSAESPIHVAMFGCSTIHSSSERRFLASAWETRVYEHSAENDCCDSITWMRQNKLSASEGIVAMAKKSYHAEDALKACLDYLTTVKGESGGPRRRFTWLDLPIEVIDAGTDVGPVQLHSMQEADVALASIFDALPTGTLLIALTQGSLEVLRYLSAIKQRTKWENDAGRQHRGVAFTRGLAPWAAGSDEMELMRVLQDVSNGTVFLRLK
jgi:RNA exonuclease 1